MKKICNRNTVTGRFLPLQQTSVWPWQKMSFCHMIAFKTMFKWNTAHDTWFISKVGNRVPAAHQTSSFLVRVKYNRLIYLKDTKHGYWRSMAPLGDALVLCCPGNGCLTLHQYPWHSALTLSGGTIDSDVCAEAFLLLPSLFTKQSLMQHVWPTGSLLQTLIILLLLLLSLFEGQMAGEKPRKRSSWTKRQRQCGPRGGSGVSPPMQMSSSSWLFT